MLIPINSASLKKFGEKFTIHVFQSRSCRHFCMTIFAFLNGLKFHKLIPINSASLMKFGEL